jgi:hypothetical protein
MSSLNWKHEISIRGVKMLDISYLFTISSILGYIIARILSRVFKFDKNKYKKDENGNVLPKYKALLGLEILVEMSIIGIILYIARQFIQISKFPLDGWKGWNAPAGFGGFQHTKLKELQNPFPISFFILFFQDNFKAKIVYFTQINKF